MDSSLCIVICQKVQQYPGPWCFSLPPRPWSFETQLGTSKSEVLSARAPKCRWRSCSHGTRRGQWALYEREAGAWVLFIEHKACIYIICTVMVHSTNNTKSCSLPFAHACTRTSTTDTALASQPNEGEATHVYAALWNPEICNMYICALLWEGSVWLQHTQKWKGRTFVVN